MLNELLTGIGAGVTFSLTTFAKKQGQEFDWTKFGSTAAVGALAGLIMGFFDMPLNASYEFAVACGAVPIIENICKALYRKVFKGL